MTAHADAATPKACAVCGRPDCNWLNHWRPTHGRAYLVSTPEGIRLQVHTDPVAGPAEPEQRRDRRALRPVEDRAHGPSEDR